MYIPVYSALRELREDVLILTTSLGNEVVDCRSLVRIEAISNYCKLYFVNGKTLVVAKVLAWFEQKLAAKGFIRLHRSHLVNLQFVLGWDNITKAAIILKNFNSIPVSRRKKKYCKETIRQFYEGQAAVAA